MHQAVLAAAATTATRATMARTLSSPLTVEGRGWGAAGRGWVGRCAVGATGAAAAFVPVGVAIWVGGGNELAATAVGPPGGKVGNLMVGAAEGFGGKLMRTVSFLGCTLEPSGGFGGIAPPGRLGIFSAITSFQSQGRIGCPGCQILIREKMFGTLALDQGTPALPGAARRVRSGGRRCQILGSEGLGDDGFDISKIERLGQMGASDRVEVHAGIVVDDIAGQKNEALSE